MCLYTWTGASPLFISANTCFAPLANFSKCSTIQYTMILQFVNNNNYYYYINFIDWTLVFVLIQHINGLLHYITYHKQTQLVITDVLYIDNVVSRFKGDSLCMMCECVWIRTSTKMNNVYMYIYHKSIERWILYQVLLNNRRRSLFNENDMLVSFPNHNVKGVWEWDYTLP